MMSIKQLVYPAMQMISRLNDLRFALEPGRGTYSTGDKELDQLVDGHKERLSKGRHRVRGLAGFYRCLLHGFAQILDLQDGAFNLHTARGSTKPFHNLIDFAPEKPEKLCATAAS